MNTKNELDLIYGFTVQRETSTHCLIAVKKDITYVCTTKDSSGADYIRIIIELDSEENVKKRMQKCFLPPDDANMVAFNPSDDFWKQYRDMKAVAIS